MNESASRLEPNKVNAGSTRNSSGSASGVHVTIAFAGRSEAPSAENTALKIIEFHLSAPRARAVQLAADFTGWQEAPIPMTKSPAGVWQARVYLAPGKYRYRYLVEADSRAVGGAAEQLPLPLPFGTLYGVMDVS